MTDKLIQAKARLELIKEALQHDREPIIVEGQSIGKTVTLEKWAIEEIVCALLELLESEDNGNDY